MELLMFFVGLAFGAIGQYHFDSWYFKRKSL